MVAAGRVAVARLVLLALGLVGCDDGTASPTLREASGPSNPSPGASTSAAAIDLSVIGCATDEPADVGDLTGAWQGVNTSVYYIRQVGACVWWFGTELVDIEPGRTGQRGFANVASGRIVGAQLHMEWADLPMGDILGGGGLTFVYEAETGRLRLVQQRGDWQPFGDAELTRIEPGAAPDATPSESASP